MDFATPDSRGLVMVVNALGGAARTVADLNGREVSAVGVCANDCAVIAAGTWDLCVVDV